MKKIFIAFFLCVSFILIGCSGSKTNINDDPPEWPPISAEMETFLIELGGKITIDGEPFLLPTTLNDLGKEYTFQKQSSS
ncbi:hypothetical protein LJC42_08150 [Eubacteriales bacterium OttesenSCG-928-K08]|nr:hypothetical protein [Eubacteriales bacterium OttesenSCG-928-K08]